MGVANHVFRRGSTYVWRRRLPADVDRNGCMQITLRTRDCEHARRIGALVTAESAAIFDRMVKKQLSPAEARGLFERVVREENARIANPNITLSSMRNYYLRPSLPGRLAPEIYARAMLRALRHNQNDAEETAFLDKLKAEETTEVFRAAASHLFDESAAHAGPFLHEEDRQFAEETVNKALRRSDGIDDDQLLAAFRVILTARAGTWTPERELTIRSANDIRPADELDPTAPLIPRAWFEDEPCPQAEVEAEAAPDADITRVADRVAEIQRDEGISAAQQQQTRKTSALFRDLTGISDLATLRQRHLAIFVDQLRKLPTSYGKSRNDRDRPATEMIKAAAKLPAAKRGLSVATVNRHLAIIKRIVGRAGAEGFAIDPFLDFDALRRRDTRRGRDKRESLSEAEVRQIFRHPVFTGCKSAKNRRAAGDVVLRDALYWLPILAAYTGARREELAGLEAQDVRQVDGIWCFDLRPNGNRSSLKNATSVRIVPIHPALIELGFLDYASSQPQGGNLFPELRRKSENAGLGASLAYRIDKIFADQLGDDRGKQSFHSFRHYVTDQLRNAQGIQKHVRMDLLGHSGEDIEDEVYGSRAPVAALKAAIARSMPQFTEPPTQE